MMLLVRAGRTTESCTKKISPQLYSVDTNCGELDGASIRAYSVKHRDSSASVDTENERNKKTIQERRIFLIEYV